MSFAEIHLHDILLALAAFFSEALGTLSGFGSSTFFLPVATFFENFHLVLALTAILHVFGNLSKIYLFRAAFQPVLFVKLFLPSVFFAGIGALLSAYLPVALLQICLGVILLFASIMLFVLKRKSVNPPPRFSFFLTAFSGFSTGLTGTGGALRGVALAALNLEKNTFVSLSSAIDIGGDLVRASIYIAYGYMDWKQWFYLPLLGGAALAGAYVGRCVLAKINQSLFEKIVTIFVFFSGLAMIFS